MPLGKRIKELRKVHKMKQEDLARTLQVSRSAVSMWETDERSPEPAIIQRMSSIFGVTIDYLFGEDAKISRERTPEEENEELYKRIQGAWRPVLTVKVPIVGVVRAGQPIFATTNIEGYEDVPANDVADAKHFFLRVRGDSMEPTIRESSLVLVRMQPEIEKGEIALVLVNGEEATIKRVFPTDGQVILRADNPKYSPALIPASEAKIVGKIVQMVVKF